MLFIPIYKGEKERYKPLYYVGQAPSVSMHQYLDYLFIHKGEKEGLKAPPLHSAVPLLPSLHWMACHSSKLQNMQDSHHDDYAMALHVDMQVYHANSVDVAIKYGMCSIHV